MRILALLPVQFLGCRSSYDIANYELGRCDIPARVLDELDRMGFRVSWVLNGQGEMSLESRK